MDEDVPLLAHIQFPKSTVLFPVNKNCTCLHLTFRHELDFQELPADPCLEQRRAAKCKIVRIQSAIASVCTSHKLRGSQEQNLPMK
jgi:hypothetical protein